MTHPTFFPLDATQEPTEEELEKKPWKFIGYRGFSTWMASDDDFFVVRRFDNLAARVILLLQWDISKLDSKLADLDFERKHGFGADLNNGSFECDDDDRQDCIRSVHGKLKEYYDFLNKYANLKSKLKAPTHSIRNVRNWLSTHVGAIDEDESGFIKHEADVFNVVTRERTPLRAFLEKFDRFRKSKVFQRAPEAYGYSSKTTIYQSDEKIDTFVNGFIGVFGLLMLITPLWILFYIPSTKYQLVVITIFITLFLGSVQSFTVARPFETLAATAAYSAVLMVFMQIGPQGTAKNSTTFPAT